MLTLKPRPFSTGQPNLNFRRVPVTLLNLVSDRRQGLFYPKLGFNRNILIVDNHLELEFKPLRCFCWGGLLVVLTWRAEVKCQFGEIHLRYTID